MLEWNGSGEIFTVLVHERLKMRGDKKKNEYGYCKREGPIYVGYGQQM